MSERVWNDAHFGVLVIGERHLAFTLDGTVMLAVLPATDPVANEDWE
jgi:hypothetical protein